MILSIFIICLGLAAVGKAVDIEPEVIDALRASGQDDVLAEIFGIDVKFLRANDSEARSEDPRYNHASHLGDIMLTEEQERAPAIDFSKYGGNRWPNGRIPYVISNDFTEEQKQNMHNWANDWNWRVNRVKLVQRTNEGDYVQIIAGNGCWSYLSKIGGGQLLSLQRNGCVYHSIFQHEFMHAAGFHHEQTRLDRDNHITVLWHNIPQEWQSQYHRVDERYYRDHRAYDFYSIMHYGFWAPGSGQPAFEVPWWVDKNRMGNAPYLGQNDVDKLNDAYW